VSAAFAERLGDRLNPILVKEVRQALRGRYFRNAFWFTLVAATLIGCAILMNALSADRVGGLGVAFFAAIFAVLAVAVHAFVPFWAFISTGGEWDENTYDLLVISNLRPRQLVLGKMLAAFVQAMLFYSAFGPFLVSTFLMPGVDLLSIVVVLAGSTLLSPALALFAIALSSLSRSRPMRIVLMAALAVTLVYATAASIFLGIGVIRSPEVLRLPEALATTIVLLASFVLVGLLALAVATARFAHEEENRSSGLRAIVLVIALSALACSWSARRMGAPVEVYLFLTIAGLVLSSVPLIFFATEAEALGRRVRKHVPRDPVLALLATPFLPGGGRGMVLFLGYAALTLGGMLPLARGAPSIGPSLIGGDTDVLQGAGVVFAYAATYLGLPAVLATKLVGSARGRALVRITIPTLLVVGMFLPALVGMFFGVGDWMQFRHPGNPGWMMLAVLEGGREARAAWRYLMVLYPLAAVSVISNVPRMLRGFREVQAASAERRARPAPARDGPV